MSKGVKLDQPNKGNKFSPIGKGFQMPIGKGFGFELATMRLKQPKIIHRIIIKVKPFMIIINKKINLFKQKKV